tara:strand:- start:51 stop:620 length:570 start_codon:yes stop_codon:yes gene_type:complete
MKALEFENISRDFKYDLDGLYWSRIYEYPLVLNLLEKYGANSESLIHNTSWGWEGVHIWFKNILDKKYVNNINSDMKKSNENNTYVYNLKDTPKEEWFEKFDFVLNISTLEEVRSDHTEVFQKSFSMVKPGGFFISTFDLPGLQLDKFEKLFNRKYIISDNGISGINSEIEQSRYTHLRCGYMVVQKII